MRKQISSSAALPPQRTLRALLGHALLASSLILASCGGSTPAAEAPRAEAAPADDDSQADDLNEADADDQDTSVDDDAQAPKQAEDADETETGKREAGDTAGLNIVYRQTPEGPVITVAGVELKANSKTIRQSDGSYAVRFELVARSVDGRMHRLLTPPSGPLSIAGVIESKGGKKERFSAERSGEDEQFIPPDDELTLSQVWPAKGQPKFWWGQKARLEVGLWGLGADADRRRAVRKLFAVSTVARDGASAVVMPPEF